METSYSFATNHQGRSVRAIPARPGSPRWSRVALFLSLIVSVEIALVYLISWVAPPLQACFVSIAVADYQARPLAAWVHATGDPAGMVDGSLLAETLRAGTTRREILQTLDTLENRRSRQPVILYVSALAVQTNDGDVYLLPGDALPDDTETWLRLRDVLEKLKACPARHKLLVLDLIPPPAPALLGSVYHDIAAAIPLELTAVPDAARGVLCCCAAGQRPHVSEELGQSVFAACFAEGLRGRADGWAGAKDGQITVKELTAFVQARVEHWSQQERGERQTPTWYGGEADYLLVAFDSAAASVPAPLPASREYPAWLLEAWKARDAVYQSGRYRLAPRLFQQLQQALLAAEQAWRAGCPETALRTPWIAESERLQEALQRATKNALSAPPQAAVSENVRKAFADFWRHIQRPISGAKSTEIDSVNHDLIEHFRGLLSTAELDAVVFEHALRDPRLEPEAVRLFDRLLHPTPHTLPRTGETLRLRRLADLAAHLDGAPWPRDVVEVLLRGTALGENAFRQAPSLPNYQVLLLEAAQMQHAGEIRLWSRGYASLDDAKKHLTMACARFEHLVQLNEQWRLHEALVDEALAELPGYLGTLESLANLRPAWDQAVVSAQALAEMLEAPSDESMKSPLRWQDQVKRLSVRLDGAQIHARLLQQSLQALRQPFTKEQLLRLERKCRSPQADFSTRRTAEALLCTAAPIFRAEDRAALCQASRALSRRLHEETLSLDRHNDKSRLSANLTETKTATAEDVQRQVDWRVRSRLALLSLAGVSGERLQPIRLELERAKKTNNGMAHWCALGTMLQRVTSVEAAQQYRHETALPRRERLAWLLPPLEHFPAIDDAEIPPAVQRFQAIRERHERGLREFQRYLTNEYHGLNLETAGIRATRGYYARFLQTAGPPGQEESHLRLTVAESVNPLTETKPHAEVQVEVTRPKTSARSGSVELRIQAPHDAWLEVTPEKATLPPQSTAKSRPISEKVALKVSRKPLADRSEQPAPLGFLIEAHYEGRRYHQVVATPLPQRTQTVQILVSADAQAADGGLDEIRVRPGETKQPYGICLKNLTNRTQLVHVEVSAGATVLHASRQPLTLAPDSVQTIALEETDKGTVPDFRGLLQVRALDAERQKVLCVKTFAVEILAPHEYVEVDRVTYTPGGTSNNKWMAQVQSARPVPGPAIAAELVLPRRRNPGLVVGGGTLLVEVPARSKESRMLFAEKIRLPGDAAQEGPVYLNIDGVPRAFVYRTTFSHDGESREPQKDERLALRLNAPASVMVGVNCLVDIEVDNAPRGATLDVALGRVDESGSFSAEVVREFADTKKKRVTLKTAKDALVFTASIQDWTATFDTRSVAGKRVLRARLLNASGKEIRAASQPLVIDNSPPVVRILPPAVKAQRGATLQVQARGLDDESGIAQVSFFLGQPSKGEIPPGTMARKGILSGLDANVWTTKLPVPMDHKGPLLVSVHVVNGAGMSSVDTATIEVLDRETVKTGLGKIHGTVVEGPRLQSNVLVTLTDEQGKEIASTRTGPDGRFLFEQLAPGRYRVICVKPESQRRAVQILIVEPGTTARPELMLTL